MKELDFLIKLKKEDRLEIVEPSDEICESYFEKSVNCMKSAKILLENNLYENSISMAYYAMYNALTALLFKAGIKCENHNGSILILGRFFGRSDLFKIISSAKKERIDNQYYLDSKDASLTKESAAKMISAAENFAVRLKLLAKSLKNDEIKKITDKINKIY